MVVMAPLKKIQKLKAKKGKVPQAEEESQSDNETEELSQEVKVIAQEVRIVQALANNDLVVRTRQMKKLKKWLQIRAQSSFPFKEDDFMRIWKGMYYHFWLSDKPLVQEELAEEMSKLLDCFEGNIDLSVNFFGAFIKTMCQQWFGMDLWRMDKYMMLVRRMLRAMFFVLKTDKWNKEAVQKFNEHMLETILSSDSSALGLAMHYFDIFFEELAKVANGDINEEQVAEFIKPFVKFLAYQTDHKLIEHCKKKVFFHLLFQSSLGREYQDKYNAWRQMGFPTKSINDLEKVGEQSDEEVEEKEEQAEEDNENEEKDQKEVIHLDPRAGNVDVFIAELPLNGKYIIDELEILLYKYDLTTKRRKMLKKILELFQKYEQGIFPLGVKTMPRFEAKSDKPLIMDKIEKLENLENELYGTDRKLRQLNKRKRRKLLKSINFDEVTEENLEDVIEKALPKNLQKRKEANKSLRHGWVEEELDESEIPSKKSKREEPANISRKQKVKNSEGVLAESEPKNKNKKLTNDLQKNTNSTLNKSKLGKELSSPNKSKVILKSNKQEKLQKKSSESPGNKTKSNVNEKSFKTTSPSKNQAAKATPSNSSSKKETLSPQKQAPKDVKTETGSSKAAVKPLVANEKPKLPKILKISDDSEIISKKPQKPVVPTNASKSEWDEPLAEGEIEYFIPSTKLRLKSINKKLNSSDITTPIRLKNPYAHSTPGSSSKKVKIALKNNTSQNPSEYIRQVRSSPSVPYDAHAKPTKGLLKPHVTPGPIDPFYKKRIGLKLHNDTI